MPQGRPRTAIMVRPQRPLVAAPLAEVPQSLRAVDWSRLAHAEFAGELRSENTSSYHFYEYSLHLDPFGATDQSMLPTGNFKLSRGMNPIFARKVGKRFRIFIVEEDE